MPKSIKKIYLDYASGVLPNASSIHEDGLKTKKKLEKARTKVAGILHARAGEILFTSGGTESNNLAIQGIVLAYKGVGVPHIITTNIEHASVLETFRLLESRKMAQITIVGVGPSGIVDPKKIKKEIKKNTVLVSVMYANNEIGTVEPIRELAREIRHYKKNLKQNNIYPFFHTDAVQAVNYLDINVEHLGVDLMSFSGAKIVGAGRVGVLYKKMGVKIENVFGGGDQEFGLRPGTENIQAIVSFADALEKKEKNKEKENIRLIKLQAYFLKQLESVGFKKFKIIVNGDLESRLPNNVNITIQSMPSDLLVVELSARNVMISVKSACKSGDGKASHVIEAISRENKEEDGSLRFSFGPDTSKEDIIYTLKSLSEILNKLAKWYIK